MLPLYCLGPPYSQRMIWSQQAAIAGSDAAAQEFAPGPQNPLHPLGKIGGGIVAMMQLELETADCKIDVQKSIQKCITIVHA